MAIKEILVMGDSVFKGVVFDAARQRYALLKDGAVQRLSSLLPLPLINKSQMGRTAPQALEWLREQSPDLVADRAVILEFGGNDCDLDWAAIANDPNADHEARTPANEFIAAMTEMVNIVRERGGKPFLSTLPPLDAKRYFEWIIKDGLSRERIMQYIGAPERIYRWQEYYNSLVNIVAKKLCCDIVPVREAFLSRTKNEDLMCIDGIHPNARGHVIIAEAAFDFATARLQL